MEECEGEDYHVEDDSEDEVVVSSDDEALQDEMFLQSKDGKDVISATQTRLNDGITDGSVIQLSENIPFDQLLYDEDIDKSNEKWMRQKRNKSGTKDDNKIKSDAMLCCPACMVTVCVDCQRHEIYKTQFRAMFVMNCRIDTNQLLHYEHKNKSKKRRKKEGPGKLIEYKPTEDTSSEAKEIELYNPVMCAQCSTEIAVYDKEEIYHFFNILESIA